MFRSLRGHLAEIFIFVLGAGAALAQALLTSNHDLLVLIIVITILLMVTTLSIKITVRDQLRDDLGRVLEQISHPRWHEAARLNVDRLRVELREWAGGRRIMRGDIGTAYQVGLVAQTCETLEAIHLALGDRTLKRWDKQTGEFSAIVEAHEHLPTKVRGRRIMVFDDEDSCVVASADGQKRIEGERAVRVCRHQVQPRSKGGLGFEVRVVWKTEYQATHEGLPPDLLISDRDEAVIVRNVSPIAATDDYETEALSDDVRVADYAALFEDLWHLAIPVSQVLPRDPSTSGKRRLHPKTWLGTGVTDP